jgi:hypothetical protein
MGRLAIVVLVGNAMLLSVVSITMTIGSVTAGNEIPTQTGDLVVSDGETRTIDGETFILEGNIIVNSGGTLIIRNSDITVNSHYKNQYWVWVHSNATLLVENSILREGPAPTALVGSFGAIEDFRLGETVIAPAGDNAQVILRNSTSELRIGPDAGSSVTLESSYLSILFWRSLQSVRATVKDSSVQMVHLWFRGETEENIGLSGLGGGGDQNVALSVEGATLDIKNSWVGMYALALWVSYGETDCRKNLTVRDSTLSEIFAVFPTESDIKLWNMTPSTFENWNIYDSMVGSGVPWDLSLINTTLGKWKLDFHGIAEVQNSSFHLDTWGEARVTVRDSIINADHHTRGGYVKLLNTVISASPGRTMEMRLLYQPEVVGMDRPPYVYEFKNSTLGPNADLEITHDNIHCIFKGELSMLIPPDRVHWFGGTISREFPVMVLDENNAPLADHQLILSDSNDAQVWSGTTDENGRASFNLTFGKDNYTEEFTLRATIGDENVTKVVGFFSDTPILLSKAVENIVPYITIFVIIVVAAIGAVSLSVRRRPL